MAVGVDRGYPLLEVEEEESSAIPNPDRPQNTMMSTTTTECPKEREKKKDVW